MIQYRNMHKVLFGVTIVIESKLLDWVLTYSGTSSKKLFFARHIYYLWYYICSIHGIRNKNLKLFTKCCKSEKMLWDPNFYTLYDYGSHFRQIFAHSKNRRTRKYFYTPKDLIASQRHNKLKMEKIVQNSVFTNGFAWMITYLKG